MDELTINPEHFIELISLVQKKSITQLKAKEILRTFIPKSFSPLHEAKKSETIDDEKELAAIIKQVVDKNKKSVDDYKNGEEKAFHFLMGQVMRATDKRAYYKKVKEILERELKR